MHNVIRQMRDVLGEMSAKAKEKYVDPESGQFRKAKGGSRFDTCVAYMTKRGDVDDPEALCAWIARKKGLAPGGQAECVSERTDDEVRRDRMYQVGAHSGRLDVLASFRKSMPDYDQSVIDTQEEAEARALLWSKKKKEPFFVVAGDHGKFFILGWTGGRVSKKDDIVYAAWRGKEYKGGKAVAFAKDFFNEDTLGADPVGAPLGEGTDAFEALAKQFQNKVAELLHLRATWPTAGQAAQRKAQERDDELVTELDKIVAKLPNAWDAWKGSM